MRSTLIFLGLLFITSPALAFSDRVLDFCFTTAHPKACLSTMLAEEQAQQRALAEQRVTTPRDLPMLYPNSLMLLGIGPALIQGVNAGFHQMQLPYVDTPQFQYTQP